MFERKKINLPFEGKIEPFKIIGNLYFIGTFQSSTHLIDTGDGLIVIDPGYDNAFYLVIDSIYKLGFKPKDVKYIINSHWHWDHVEATAALKDLSGAKTLIGKGDKDNAMRYFTPDILISDGDKLSLGNTVIEFMETPGHTKGTISFFFNTTENDNTYRVGMFGGAGCNTLVKGAFDFDGCRESYINSINRLMKEKVDVFIGNHTWNNDTFGKAKLLKTSKTNPFIDDKLWKKFLEFCLDRLNAIIKENR
ncbi:MAG: MBL fold metallo-hydrolase [Clostridia bacterium]|nr:MBL fold metallo-hydrolase [Clostridia bacterium]